MKEEQDYMRDIAEMRSMMERSSKFLSLSGLSGVMAGFYALTGAYFAWKVLGFNPQEIAASATDPTRLLQVVSLAIVVLILAIGTAVLLSSKKANKRGEKLWNATARRLLMYMAIPLLAGGLLILILMAKGLIGLVAPFTLLFYGLALFNASKVTYEEVKYFGIIEITLGLIGAYYVEYGLLCWALGFGVLHIIYGIYIHYKYER